MNHISYDITTPNGLKHFQEQLNVLINYNSDPKEKYYNDIHIYQEESFIILEWDHVPYDGSWGGKFQFVAENQIVMTEEIFPDNHIELCYDEEDFKKRLKEFLKDNPGWEKTSYGTWTNRIENERFIKKLEEEKKEHDK